MKTKIIFAGLLGLAVMLPLTACSDSQDDFKKGVAAHEAKNYPEAMRWFRKAAEQGNAEAQVYLGFMYQNGRGVKRDDREAVRWHRKAAEQGEARAQFNLGFMYQNGRGVKRDDREALRWYRKAAEQGNAEAQVYLGFMYQNGRGVAQDYVQAHKWLNIASALGNKNTKSIAKSVAKIGRQEVESKMTPQQIADAQREATEWLEAYEKRRK